MFTSARVQIPLFGLVLAVFLPGCPQTVPPPKQTDPLADFLGQAGYPCLDDGTCHEGLLCLETGELAICVSSTPDCSGTWGGTSTLDNCNTCDDDPTNDCTQDCAGAWGGTATLDNCDTCDDDPTNDCTQDCAGAWGGIATLDNCDTCDDDPTNDCTQDCAGTWGGTAALDNCDTCDDDPANDCTQDCAGTWGGAATMDNCNTCDNNASNDCTQDCAGTWGGAATMDNCNTCDNNASNDCTQDCAGTWGGTATLDKCGTCDDDPTNDCTQDCAGAWGGNAMLDNCNHCDSDPTNDCQQDCAGTWGGTATMDNCDNCDDDPVNDCTQDCMGEWGGNHALDACHVCDADDTNDCQLLCQATPHPDGGVTECAMPELAACGPGTLALHGVCIPEEEVLYHLPFPPADDVDAGTANPLIVSQGFQGYYSHSNRQRYAVDFDVPVGTPIAAARDGYVYAVKKDSNSGCASSACADQANYIRILHGDGTETFYLHLDYEGAFVEVNDHVCAGDIIGASGDTGWTTGPHLHFSVNNAYGDTIPFRFSEMLEISEGLPIPGHNFISDNHEIGSCAETALNGCPADFYLHRGLLLDPGFPCITDDASNTPTFSGINVAGSAHTFLSIRRLQGSVFTDTIELCLENDDDGAFSTDVNWSELGGPGDVIYVFATAAILEEENGEMVCGTFYGWERSFSVLLK